MPTLDAAHGAELVADEEALTACLAGWLADPTARKAVADAAAAAVEKLGGALERTLDRARALSDAAAARAAAS